MQCRHRVRQLLPGFGLFACFFPRGQLFSSRLTHHDVCGHGIAVCSVLDHPQRIAHSAGGIVGVYCFHHSGVCIAPRLCLHRFCKGISNFDFHAAPPLLPATYDDNTSFMVTAYT